MIHRLLSLGLRTANRGLRPFGVRLQRTNTPTRGFADFFRHVKALGFDPRTVIDVGIARGTPDIYAAFPSAQYVLLEPLEECKPVLDALARRLNARVVLAAAGATNGEVVFNVHDDLSGSSLFPQAEGQALDGRPRRVRMVRLDAILDPVLDRPVLLKIDTQGAELQVLEGLGARLAEIDLVLVEASLMAFREGTPLFADVVEAFRRRGFVVYDILEGHFRQLDSALAQVDLAFVREDSALRRDSRFFDERQLEEYARRWHPRPSRT
jgi:FkbM family methyltransferase